MSITTKNAQNSEYAFVAPAGNSRCQALDDLQNAQNDLASYNSQLVSLQTQPERVQNAMYNASQQLQQIRSRLDGTDVGETALRPSQKVLMQAQQALLNAGD
ncbi:hypothetical protein ACNKHT_02760 [Shigella flexneri]